MVHTRLAILDLSEAGHQPMVWTRAVAEHRAPVPAPTRVSSQPTGEDRSASVLVFNGEIYNYRELRNALEAEGEKFSSAGDTEVLLRLLVREGAACLPKLAGMFALAFWDGTKSTALLARDPLGIKPLYYREDEGALAFASVTRVLRRAGDRLDSTAIRNFFLWGAVPDPGTLSLSVRQLPAGHFLQWSAGAVCLEDWRLGAQERDHPRAFSRASVSQAAVITRIALEESVQRHLVSDVPVGIFLSGGTDSTVLLALARQALGAKADIRTFSIGFDDPEFDESAIARRTAQHFGALHTEWRMSLKEGASEIRAFFEAIDQPGIDGFNTWCVSKLARREGMKVVLSGVGGDELFAGYGSFKRVPHFRRLYQKLGPLRTLVAALLETKAAGSPWRRLADYLRGSGEWLHAYHVQRGIFTAAEAKLLAQHLADGDVAKQDWVVPNLPNEPRAIVAELEMTRYMRYQLLRDSDVYSMAHGLELRVPFVDARLTETLSLLPPEVRFRQGKVLLVEAVPEVPEWVRNQPKRGFRFPFQQWVEGQFGELLESASKTSPVPLKAWYRKWAVAAATHAIARR